MKTVSEYVSEKYGIDIRLYNPIEERDTSPGYTMKLDGTQFILLNSELPHQEQKTTFFHELGHCLMDYRENNAQSRREHEAVAEMTVSEFFAEMFAVVMNAIEINKEIIFNQEPERGAAMKDNVLKLVNPTVESSQQSEADNSMPIYYGTKELAKMWNSSPDTVREVMRRDDFPLLKIGKNLKVQREALIKWGMERRD